MGNTEFEIVRRDSGWAYKIEGRWSPVYEYRDDAIAAAQEETGRAKTENTDELEEGLEDTFPASDPVSATAPGHSRSKN
jgi:hypothetical protein